METDCLSMKQSDWSRRVYKHLKLENQTERQQKLSVAVNLNFKLSGKY